MIAKSCIPRLTRRQLLAATLAVSASGGLGEWGLAAAQDATPASATDVGFSVTELPGIGGRSWGATAVNDAGVIVGWASLPSKSAQSSRSRAVRWTNGEPTVLESLGGEHDSAYGINNHGVIVGSSLVETGVWHACWWDTDGHVTDLTPDPDYSIAMATAYDINDRGDIVGNSSPAWWGTGGPLLWFNGEMMKLPTVREDGGGRALAINETGLIVGDGYGGHDSLMRAVRWRGGAPEFLGGLGIATARGVNNRGDIVGWEASEFKDLLISGPTSAFLWNEGRIASISSPSSGGGCRAYAINDLRQVVGTVSVGSPPSTSGPDHLGITPPVKSTHAFFWEAGNLIDLGTLGGPNSEADDINAAGLIVGSASAADGSSRAVAWTRNAASIGTPAVLSATGERAGPSYSIRRRADLAA